MLVRASVIEAIADVDGGRYIVEKMWDGELRVEEELSSPAWLYIPASVWRRALTSLSESVVVHVRLFPCVGAAAFLMA